MAVEIIDFDIRPGTIDGLAVLTMKQVTDERGMVREFFRRSAFVAAGFELAAFQQINVTVTRRGALRGLHAEAMTKLVAVVHGAAMGAYVDFRVDSPTFGTVEVVDLVPGTQVLVPEGVANGFQALVDDTQYVYCFDREWVPGMYGLACSPLDPALGLEWPLAVDVDDPAQISAKDRAAPSFVDLHLREG